ncbi:hypothetical protein [Kitasatospora sp. P5_F3]
MRKWFGKDPFAVIMAVVIVLWLAFLLRLAVTDDRYCPGHPTCGITEH